MVTQFLKAISRIASSKSSDQKVGKTVQNVHCPVYVCTVHILFVINSMYECLRNLNSIQHTQNQPSTLKIKTKLRKQCTMCIVHILFVKKQWVKAIHFMRDGKNNALHELIIFVGSSPFWGKKVKKSCFDLDSNLRSL